VSAPELLDVVAVDCWEGLADLSATFVIEDGHIIMMSSRSLCWIAAMYRSVDSALPVGYVILVEG